MKRIEAKGNTFKMEYSENKKEMVAKAIMDLMKEYDANRAKWIKVNGDDAGFDTWFTAQVL